MGEWETHQTISVGGRKRWMKLRDVEGRQRHTRRVRSLGLDIGGRGAQYTHHSLPELNLRTYRRITNKGPSAAM